MRRRLLVLGAVALVLAWAVLAAIWLVRAQSDLQAGRDAAERAREHLGADEVADRAPLGDLRTAAHRFSSARDLSGGVVLAPVRILPFVGRQLRSVHALSSAAARVADAGADAVDAASKVIDRPAAAGKARVDQVRSIARIVDEAATRVEDIDLGPKAGLLGTLRDARRDLAEDLDKATRELRDARAGSKAALSLVTGPRRYLVVAANNAEMRSGSGMWLQGGVLHAQDGELELDPMVSLPLDAAPPKDAVTPTGALASVWGFLEPGNEWRSLMASPQFEESARTGAAMWKAAGRGDVDGVLAVDAIGLQSIIEATGPVAVDEQTISADDVPQYILHDQYERFANGDIQDSATRQESSGALARAAVGAVNHGDYRPSTLLRTLGEAVAGRHLLAWSADETEAAGWKAAGMDGTLDEQSLLLSVLNTGSNKLDWFLETFAGLRAAKTEEGWDITVEVTLRNTAPTSGEPRYVVGPFPGSGHRAGEYLGILALNLPDRARDVRFDGVEGFDVAGADGPTRVVGTVLGIPAGESRTVVLRFSISGAAGSFVIEPSARVPAVHWEHESESWEDSSPHTAKIS